MSPTPAVTISGTALAKVLVAALAGERLSVHVDQTGVSTRASGPGRMVTSSVSYDISGRDIAFHVTAHGDGQTSDTAVVVAGETVYIRTDGGAWTTTPRAGAAWVDQMIADIRLTDDPADLTYIGPEVVEGRPLHHLAALGTIPYGTWTGGTGNYDSFDIWVEEDGTPVLIKLVYTASDTTTGDQIKGTSELRYSNLGRPIEIVPPSVQP